MTKTDWQSQNIHKGEWLKDQIKETGFKVGDVAEKINLSRTQIWRWFSTPNLDYKKMKKVCDVIGVKISDYFPEYISQESDGDESEEYRQKYYSLLEQFSNVSEEFAMYRAKYPATRDENGTKKEN